MPDSESIKKAILDGIHEANVLYEEWSRGWWVTDSGVEGHVVSTIARMLHRGITGQGSVVMELLFRDIRNWSESPRPRGRPRKTLKPNNRADIVLRDTNDRRKYQDPWGQSARSPSVSQAFRRSCTALGR